MKKIVSILVIIIMALALITACGGDFKKGERIISDAEKKMAESIEEFREYFEWHGAMDQFLFTFEEAHQQDIADYRDIAIEELNKLNLSESEKEKLLEDIHNVYNNASMLLSGVIWAE
ncbi:MAG: hypothetical protein FWD44_02140 [Oscillospiraceae bacterium]|nr:hypothetical protein [Oscillospiraceae bacterium]